MTKYFGIYEYNQYEGSDHIMYFPYKVGLESEVEIYMLSAVVQAITKLDEEFRYEIKDARRTKEEIEIAIDVMAGTGATTYWDALEIGEPINITKLIICMVKIYYEMIEEYDQHGREYEASECISAEKIYKGRIIYNFKMG